MTYGTFFIPLKVDPSPFPFQNSIKLPASSIAFLQGDWSLISNFGATPVVVDIGWGKMTYLTSEHAFAAAKARQKQDHDVIRSAHTPGSAKIRGRDQNLQLRHDWDVVKFQVMADILCAKFNQSVTARHVLGETKFRMIYEGNTWGDQVWGVTDVNHTGRWAGRNALGELLMMERARRFGVDYIKPEQRVDGRFAPWLNVERRP